ncbi:MAG: ABC transporter permease [Peptococcaceae bacterium]|nr:ABC transporter permease [Peptococcaceae bacterium]
MSFARRAIASIIRKPGKTLILLVIIFVLGNIIAGAVSIRQAATNAQVLLRTKMSPVVSLGFDNEKYAALWEQNPALEIEDIALETLEKIGVSPYVKYFDYSAKVIGISLSSGFSSSSEDPTLPGISFINAIGVNNPEIVDLKEGLIQLVSGRVFTEQEIKNLTYVALIPQEMAEKNNLSVGSVIPFECGFDTEAEKPRTFDFEIIGIYRAKIMEGEFRDGIYAPNRALNEMNEMANNEVLKDPNVTESDYQSILETFKIYYTTLFILNDPTDLNAFREEVATLLPAYYTVTVASNSLEKSAAPLQSIREIVTLVLCVAVVAAVLTMSLLITLFLRDRRQEIGIYLSLGERKFKVAGQILVEIAVIALMAITLSLFTGNLLSGAISEQMLTDQMAADQANVGQYSPGDYAYRYQGATATEQLAESYTTSLDTTIVLLFYIIGFVTVCVSVLLPIFYITRLNPKKILMGGELEL